MNKDDHEHSVPGGFRPDEKPDPSNDGLAHVYAFILTWPLPEDKPEPSEEAEK